MGNQWEEVSLKQESRGCPKKEEHKFEKRKTPEFDGGDRRCAGILSDLFFDCDGFVYPADREKFETRK